MRRSQLAVYFSVILLILQWGCGSSPHRDSAERDVDTSGIADAIPRHEPKSRLGNPPSYEVFGRRYKVMDSAVGYEEEGIASWYGKKFHGRRTSSGEIYDMYAMTAAHKSVPLPTYMEVIRVSTGKRIVVRVNDRGPFHHNRIIDLSYAAAKKLGMAKDGIARVRIRALQPGNSRRTAGRKTPTPRSDNSTDTTTRVKKKSHNTTANKKLYAPVRVEQRQINDTPTISDTNSRQMDTYTAESRISTTTKASQKDGFFIQLGIFRDIKNAQRLYQRAMRLQEEILHMITQEKQGETFYNVRLGPIYDIQIADRIINRLPRSGIHNYQLTSY